jgi:protein Mpv17
VNKKHYSPQQRFNTYFFRRRNNPFAMNSSAALGGKKESTEEDLSVADRVEASSYSTTLPDSPVSATEEHNSGISSTSNVNSSSSITESSSSSKSNTELDKVTKALNAILLAASFGWAIYTILKVDSGMTRGWTQQEIMMRIPIDNWRSYEYNLNASPIETKTWINVIIYLLGDWLSQTIFQKKNILDFDASRTIKNGFIGLCFGPLVHEYYEFSDRILPLDVDINRLYKIIMDQTIYLAVKCSIYIIAVGLLSGSTLQESIENVKNRIKTVMFTAVRIQYSMFSSWLPLKHFIKFSFFVLLLCFLLFFPTAIPFKQWSFWPLVHCVTYTVIPARYV